MKSIEIASTGSLVNQQAIAEGLAALQPIIKDLNRATSQGYSTQFASINLPLDQDLMGHIAALVGEKKKLKATLLVVIGIGGSNLGAKAVYQTGGLQQSVPILWADTVDSDSLFAMLAQVERHLKAGRNVLLNVISKSGATTETIANFECFLAVLKQHRPDTFADFVVATTDKDSKLWQLAHAQNFTCLEIPARVGGRFSVLSAAGLFPLAFAGVDIVQLSAGAAAMRTICLKPDAGNLAALSAISMPRWYQQGYAIHDLFLFCPAWEDMGKWYRQLVGESLGKEKDISGKPVHVGITPTVSVGSTDLHSVGQLYLAGPYNTATTFVKIEKNNHTVTVPNYSEYDALVPHIQNKSLATIMNAIFEGTVHAYAQQKRPHLILTIPEKSAWYCGQFLQYKMIEIMYLGYLLQVDPFDQPHVELYKRETRNILSSLR
jgi:glucose-6-phosphate isomerase